MSDIWDLIASFDIVEPLTLAAYQATSGGDWVKLEWSRAGGWRGIDVERELKRFFIPVHGRGFTGKTEEQPAGTLFCYVKREQAKWAEYVLRRAGVPLLTEIDERNATWAGQHDGPVPQWDGRPPVAPTGTRVVDTPTSPTTKHEATKPGAVRRLVDWLVGE